MKRGPVNIRRFNGKREIRVNADLVDPDASVTEILDQIRVEVIPELNVMFPGVRVEYQGQQKESQRNMHDLLVLFPLAFLAIVFVLMIQFKSFEQPVIILIMIPIAILGSIWGHGIHGKPLSMLSLWGIVALSGVVINDAVVFLSKFNLLIKEGNTVKESILKTGKSRLRPIILTTLTTSFGLFPLVLEKKSPGTVPDTNGYFPGLWCGFRYLVYPFVFSCVDSCSKRYSQRNPQIVAWSGILAGRSRNSIPA